jgi:NO-binding membrane sensor protein with MHYT domain
MVFLVVAHKPKIIALSFGIAFIGSYLTICLCEHYRLYFFAKNKSKLLGKYSQLCIMSCSLGGIAIWGMHFVGMASMTLATVDGVVIPISFHCLPTFISLVFVILFSMFGLYVSSLDVIFTKSKTEIVELFVKNASELSMKQIKEISAWRILTILATQSVHYLSLGGLLTGIGVCSMHYLGMRAMSFEGHIVWDVGIVVTSIVIALVISTVAFWILFRLLSLHQHIVVLRFICATVMAMAVSGFHYTGYFDSSVNDKQCLSIFSQEWLLLASNMTRLTLPTPLCPRGDNSVRSPPSRGL